MQRWLTNLLIQWSRVLIEAIYSHSAHQEIHQVLWKPKVHYCIHKSLPWVSVVNQMNLALILFLSRSILILSCHLLLILPSDIFLSGFPTKMLHEFILTRATCSAYLTLLNLITLIMFVEEYKFRSSSLCIFLQPPVPPSLLCSQPPPPRSQTPSLNVRDQVSHQ
jgi:hypothetical protein